MGDRNEGVRERTFPEEGSFAWLEFGRLPWMQGRFSKPYGRLSANLRFPLKAERGCSELSVPAPYNFTFTNISGLTGSEARPAARTTTSPS